MFPPHCNIVMQDSLELLLPQIVWHDNRGAIQSVDASPSAASLRPWGMTTMWYSGAPREGVVSFIQALAGHTKVRGSQSA